MGCAGRRTDPRNLPRCRSNRRGASFGQGGVNGNDSEARPWEKADKMREVWSADARSEEHTSELQSQSNLVCRLLLEKKKHLTISVLDRTSTWMTYSNIQ